MSTAIRRAFLESDTTAELSSEARASVWGWLAFVLLIAVAAFALGSGTLRADVSAGIPEPPYGGWGN